MKIVKFKDGNFAIRRGWLLTGYEYRSLRGDFWWSKHFSSFRYCLGSYQEVECEFNRLTDNGKPVKASPNA